MWRKTSSNTVALGLNLVPFAGIAFLWFIGVLRDRLGEFEDRFFSTVFLGSGLLFLAMLFASAAVAGGIISAYAAKPEGLLASVTFTFARAATYEIMNIYTVKMAAPLRGLTVAGMQSFSNAAVTMQLSTMASGCCPEAVACWSFRASRAACFRSANAHCLPLPH